jgi:hypothetical protein
VTGRPGNPAAPRGLRLLLDEHYPASLARALSAGGLDTVAVVPDRPMLLGACDIDVLRQAAGEGRVVVTEDVTTFPVAIAAVPDHCGVIFCRSSAFRRTPRGIAILERSLLALAATPPAGLGEIPLVWWLAPLDSREP